MEVVGVEEEGSWQLLWEEGEGRVGVVWAEEGEVMGKEV
jgi:hypothetical protein